MHERWEERLPFYVAGALSPYEQAAVEQHLSGCAFCRNKVELWRTVAATVKEDVNARAALSLPELSVQQWGRRKGMVSIKQHRLLSPRPFLAVVGYALSAAVVLLVLGVWLLSSGLGRPSNRNATNQAVIVDLTPAPSPSPTPESLPSSMSLTGITYEAQTWNNGGPANLAMALSYYGWEGDQETARQWLRPNREDKSVTPEQMVDYVNVQTPYRALYRFGGTTDVLKRVIAAGFLVIIEEGFQLEGEDWLGHYLLIMGYDDMQGNFLTYDSYLGNNQGEGRPQPYSRLDEDWRHFNRVFIIVYEPSQETVLWEALGDYANPQNASRFAMQAALDDVVTNPEDQWGWFNLGSTYVALGDTSKAAEAFDTARQQNLPWRIMWYQFGPYEAYYHVGRYEDIVALAESTLANTPYVEETYYWLGMAYLGLGDPDAAFEQFRKVFDTNANFKLVLLPFD